MKVYSKRKFKLLRSLGIGIERDFDEEIKRWFANKGDQTHRLDYELDKTSIVLDVGGFEGDFAASISEKFGAKVFLFEPVKSFYEECRQRFSEDSNIVCIQAALSDTSGKATMKVDGNASSIHLDSEQEGEKISTLDFREFIETHNISQIDLIKINIEGGEFELLPIILDSNLIKKVKNIQVQFHNFIDDAEYLRYQIRKNLSATHKCTWCYDFVWENWEVC